MRMADQESVPGRACSTLEDPEYFKDIFFQEAKCKTNFYNISYNEGPCVKEDLLSLYNKVSERKRASPGEAKSISSVFDISCNKNYFTENDHENLFVRNHDCCPVDSSLPKSFRSKNEHDVDRFGGNCLNRTFSDEPSSNNYVEQCFENNFVGPVFSRVNVEYMDYPLPNDRFEKVCSSSFRTRTRNEYPARTPESLPNQRRCRLQNDLSSLPYFPELDLLDKSSVNWTDPSCDEFLIPKFNFYKFYKPLSTFSFLH